MWLTDRRRSCCALRTLLTTAAILAAGLLPYLFIVIRSNQPGAYLESKGTTSSRRLPRRDPRPPVPGPRVRVRLVDRVDRAAAGASSAGCWPPSSTVPGRSLAAVGVAVLAPDDGLPRRCCCWSAPSRSAFALNYSVVDTPVFLIPVLLVLWLLAASAPSGSPALPRASVSQRPRWPSRACRCRPGCSRATSRSPTAAATPRRRSSSTGCSRRCRPARVVHEDFLVDRLVMFKLLTDPRVSRDAIDLVDRDADAIGRVIDRHGRSSRSASRRAGFGSTGSPSASSRCACLR